MRLSQKILDTFRICLTYLAMEQYLLLLISGVCTEITMDPPRHTQTVHIEHLHPVEPASLECFPLPSQPVIHTPNLPKETNRPQDVSQAATRHPASAPPAAGSTASSDSHRGLLTDSGTAAWRRMQHVRAGFVGRSESCRWLRFLAGLLGGTYPRGIGIWNRGRPGWRIWKSDGETC